MQGCAWSLPLGTAQRKPPLAVVDISLQRPSSFAFIFLKSHSILPFLLCSAPHIHPGGVTNSPGQPVSPASPAGSHVLIPRAQAVLAGAEVWQGMKQLVPLLEKEVPPKSSQLAFLPCPSPASGSARALPCCCVAAAGIPGRCRPSS